MLHSSVKGNYARSPLKINLSNFFAMLPNLALRFVHVNYPFSMGMSINMLLLKNSSKSICD